MTNPLQNLTVDKWYKGLLVLGSCLVVLSLPVELKGIDNNLVQCASLGLIFIGIGEWINHPLQTQIGPGFKITSYNRLPSMLGSLFDILEFLVVVFGVWKFR